MPLTTREKELLHLLEIYISHLEESKDTDPTTVAPFGSLDASVQRWLQLAIQCCLDLGDSLLARANQPEPSRMRDIFGVLARIGVIDLALARALEQLTDYRNALAHAYADLTPVETWRRLRAGLAPLSEFAAMVSLQ